MMHVVTELLMLHRIIFYRLSLKEAVQQIVLEQIIIEFKPTRSANVQAHAHERILIFTMLPESANIDDIIIAVIFPVLLELSVKQRIYPP